MRLRSAIDEAGGTFLRRLDFSADIDTYHHQLTELSSGPAARCPAQPHLAAVSHDHESGLSYSWSMVDGDGKHRQQEPPDPEWRGSCMLRVGR